MPKYLSNVDLNKNQLLNAVIQQLATAPATPVKGLMYFNTATNRAFIYNGTDWVAMDALGASMTGANIVDAINGSASLIDNDNLSTAANTAITKAHDAVTVADTSSVNLTLTGQAISADVIFGTTATTATAGNDARLSNARTPTAHASTHITAGSDMIPAFTPTASGLVPLSGGGTTKYLRADGSFQVPPDTNTTYVDATQTVAGLMPFADKVKLDGIAAGAQVNVATNLTEGTRTTTGVPINSSTGTGATLSAATTALAGVMSSADKTKLDGIAAGAQVNVATNLAQGTRTTTTVPITSSTGTSATLAVATTTLAGVMSSADKTKLDGVATGATANVGTVTGVTGTLPVVSSGGAAPAISMAKATASVDGYMSKEFAGQVDTLTTALPGLATTTVAQGYATTALNSANGYTDSAITALITGAPGTLDTLNELAAALGDDPNFATTIATNLSTKTGKFVATVGDGAALSYVLTHNFNSRDVVVMLREVASPYAVVMTDIEMTTVNTITVKFAEAPTAAQYSVTIIG